MSDDEWTTIPSRSRGRNHKPAPPRSLHKTSPDETPTPRTEGPFRSVDDIKAEYGTFETQWLTSSTKSSLNDLLKTHLPATLQITSAICLGVGTFDPADGSWQAKRSAFLQLLAFESIVSYIEEAQGTKVKRITQEPVLTPNDEAFLKDQLSHEVAASPKAFDMVDEKTLLFGVHLYRPVYAAALQKCLPGIFVGTAADVWDTATMEKVDTERLQEMAQTHHKLEFPEEKHGTVFLNTSIFFQKNKSEQTHVSSSETADSKTSSQIDDHGKPASAKPKMDTPASKDVKSDDAAKLSSETTASTKATSA